jgi:hypothetical protein
LLWVSIFSPLEVKIDLVPQVEGEGNGDYVEDPPARFIPHDMFKHWVVLRGGSSPQDITQGVDHCDAGKMDEPPAGF